MYADTKISRFQILHGVENAPGTEDDFDLIDGFKERVEPYVFDKISIKYDTNTPIEVAFQARLQVLMSSVLLRSLMLKEGLVKALNDSNFPAYHACLKSFFEVPALLGYVAAQIEEQEDYRKLIELMKPLTLGSGSSAGSLRIGTVNPVRVGTMFEELDRIYKKICIKSGTDALEVQKRENLFQSMYGDICNFGHINWNAHLSVGLLLDGIWSTNKDTMAYKQQFYQNYSAGFVCGITAICMMCDYISRDIKVEHFSKLNNPRYFSV